jgi:hypothetical protein
MWEMEEEEKAWEEKEEKKGERQLQRENNKGWNGRRMRIKSQKRKRSERKKRTIS